jgi:uncharacterized protein (TIGR03435 family)
MTYKATCGVLLAVCGALGQTADNRPAFEVAAVRPSAAFTGKNAAELKRGFGMQINGAQVDVAMMSLADLIRQAYDLKPYQVSGPDWMNRERYDIHAKLPAGATPNQVPAMLQTLLADRFRLTFHREDKELAVYALIVGKNGLKIKAAEPDPPGGADTASKYTVSGGALRLDRKMTMPSLCSFLLNFMDRPVIDMTGLDGTYGVLLEIPVDELKRAKIAAEGMRAAGDTASDPAGGSVMFAAVQQLGLKLEARKAPADILVVDHAEKVPTEN